MVCLFICLLSLSRVAFADLLTINISLSKYYEKYEESGPVRATITATTAREYYDIITDPRILDLEGRVAGKIKIDTPDTCPEGKCLHVDMYQYFHYDVLQQKGRKTLHIGTGEFKCFAYMHKWKCVNEQSLNPEATIAVTGQTGGAHDGIIQMKILPTMELKK